jgi:hypothetical protein
LTALQTKARSAAQHKLICERSTKVLDSALAQNDYDNAEKIAALSLVSAKATMGESIERSAAAAQTRVGVLKTAYEAAKSAREKWEADPSDADAAYTWGEFLCLYKGDWEAGLPLLARSTSKPLGALAARDLGPLGRTEQLSLADAWWQAAAEATNDLSRRELRARSLVWYRNVATNISGFEAVRVRKRVEDLQRELSPFPVGEAINLMTYLKESRDVSGRAFVNKDDWELDSGSTIMSPLLIYGSYEYTMNMRWEGNNTGPYLRVPVGNKEAHIYLGSSGRLALQSGSASFGAKAVEFKKGQPYSITISVTADDPNASIRIVVNKKPQLSWDGHLDDLYEWTQAQTERVPRIRVQGSSKFSLSTMQLKLTDGWVETLP